MKKFITTIAFLTISLSFAKINPKVNLEKIIKTNKIVKSVKKNGDLQTYCAQVQLDIKESFTNIYPNEPDFVNAIAFGAYLGCMK